MKTYWYYTAVIFTEDGEIEFSNAVETTSDYFPVANVLIETCEETGITPEMLSIRFVTRIDWDNYEKISEIIQGEQ